LFIKGSDVYYINVCFFLACDTQDLKVLLIFAGQPRGRDSFLCITIFDLSPHISLSIMASVHGCSISWPGLICSAAIIQEICSSSQIVGKTLAVLKPPCVCTPVTNKFITAQLVPCAFSQMPSGFYSVS